RRARAGALHRDPAAAQRGAADVAGVGGARFSMRVIGVPRALVLGGGGVAGIAWELGILLGLRDAGVDVTDADRIVGTSAGAAVAAQVLSGVPLEELYERQLSPALLVSEIRADLDPEQMMRDF